MVLFLFVNDNFSLKQFLKSQSFNLLGWVLHKNFIGGLPYGERARFSTSVYTLVPGRNGNVVFKAVKQRNCARKDEVYILRFEENPNVHLEFECACKEEEALPVKPKSSKAGKTGQSTIDEPKKKGNTKVDEGDIEKMVALSDQGRTYADIVKELNLQIGNTKWVGSSGRKKPNRNPRETTRQHNKHGANTRAEAHQQRCAFVVSIGGF